MVTVASHTVTVVAAAVLQAIIAVTIAALSIAATVIAARKPLKEVSASALLRQKPKVIAPATPVAAVLTAHTAEFQRGSFRPLFFY